jgi:endonuclease/exonuclease/phosphatase family metal-dependent hydrolase
MMNSRLRKCKQVLRATLIFAIVVVLLFAAFLLTVMLTDYRPAKETVLVQRSETTALPLDTIETLTWNIGYAGLDSSMDFFYDGGKQTRTNKTATLVNLDSIVAFIRDNTADFVFLQEVDRRARRSWNIDEVSAISTAKNDFFAVYATNYETLFVPMPLTAPMGRVSSGIMTLSRYLPSQSLRYACPAKNAPFPQKLFLPDRCFTACRYRLKNNRELVLLNTHNSAFDDGGKQRNEEMLALKNFMLAEYDKGNCVIAGGDWNQLPPLQTADRYRNIASDCFEPAQIPADFMPATWQWIADGKPTNRFTDEPYVKGKTKETLIDFFLISPNVEMLSVETVEKNFRNSDHNPVRGTFKLNYEHE